MRCLEKHPCKLVFRGLYMYFFLLTLEFMIFKSGAQLSHEEMREDRIK